MGDPDATALIFQKEPVAGLVVRRVGRGESMSGEGGISIIICNRQVEIRGEFGAGREELRNDFAVTGGDELCVGVDGLVRNFMIEIAAELAGGFGGVVGGLGIIGFGGAGEEKIRVCNCNANGVLLEVGEGCLEGNGENNGAFVITLTVEVDAVAVESADVIGEVAPEAGEFVAVKTADFDGAFGGDVSDTGGGGVSGGEDGGKINWATVEDDLILRVEAGVQEAIGREGKILAVLAPGVTVDDGEGENLFAAVRREKGIERFRGLNFAVCDGLGLFDLFLLGGVFGG